MPGFDGTGPRGRGPLTGRGRGICGRLFTNMKGNRRVIWPALIATAVGTILKDAGNPDGVTRHSLGYLRDVARKALLRVERDESRVLPGQKENREV